MHYYQFNIGDYASHTRYLTPIQDLAYRRLLDLYYLQEKPIPKENPAALVGLNDCSTDVERVLNEYFLLTEKGWVNKRADEAIREFHSKKKTASLAGKKSAESRRVNKDGASERPLNKPINTVQPTIKHKPRTKKHITTLSGKPDGLAAKDILDHLNKKTGRNYQPISAHLHMIDARIKDFSAEDCIAVIDMKVAEWLSDEKMNQYLRPATLFNATKFASYQGTIGQSNFKLSPNFWMER
jgi:uncharacterized phage protein (TIGR02220 family)